MALSSNPTQERTEFIIQAINAKILAAAQLLVSWLNYKQKNNLLTMPPYDFAKCLVALPHIA